MILLIMKIQQCEKCPNMEFFLVCSFPYSVRMRENTDQKKKKLGIWTLFTQCKQWVKLARSRFWILISIFSHNACLHIWNIEAKHRSCTNKNLIQLIQRFICKASLAPINFLIVGKKLSKKEKGKKDFYFLKHKSIAIKHRLSGSRQYGYSEPK